MPASGRAEVLRALPPPGSPCPGLPDQPGRRRGTGTLGRDADMMSAVSMMLRSLLPERVACEGRELMNVVAAP